MSTNESPRRADYLALALLLGGIVLAVSVLVVGRLDGKNFTTLASMVFFPFSISALILGALTRSSPIGRTALISSALMLVGVLALG